MSENITVLRDETLGGIEREYREVKRKAAVGERVKITAEDMLGERRRGEVYTVINTKNNSDLVDTDGKWNDGSTLNLSESEYVVLEPTDIVRVDGVRYRMVERKADVGERVIIVHTTDTHAIEPDKIGRVYVILEAYDDTCGGLVREHAVIIDEQGLARALYHDQYLVLEPVEAIETLQSSVAADMQRQIDGLLDTVARLALRVSELEAKCNAHIRRILALETQIAARTVQQVVRGPVNDDLPSFAQRRDEVIERAKRDVAELLAEYTDNIRTIDFVINRDKRVIVALCRVCGLVKFRGIAKCAPGDVFNTHIGRAIALRRALGLPVPDEYLNAPQPTEVRVGDIVLWRSSIDPSNTAICKVVKIDGVKYWLDDGWDFVDTLKVIDDSHEETEVAPV